MSHCALSQPELAVSSRLWISTAEEVLKPKQSQDGEYSTRSLLTLLWEQDVFEEGE